MVVYLLKNFNNYLNRIVKKYDSIIDYGPYAIEVKNNNSLSIAYTNYNFNPNDGITTNIMVGRGEFIETPDYVVICDENYNIDSRWFVIESKRTRGGQYDIKLYRDTIADFYEQIKQSPCFIEKATLDSTNPLIFNSEGMTFNQIKTSETLIKDKSNCPWVVGYYAKNTPNENLKGNIAGRNLSANYDILIESSFAGWKYNATETPFYLYPSDVIYLIYGNDAVVVGTYDRTSGYCAFNLQGKAGEVSTAIDNSIDYGINFNDNINEFYEEYGKWIKSQSKFINSKTDNYIVNGNYGNKEETNYFLNLNDKVVKDQDGKYFNINLIPGEIEQTELEIVKTSNEADLFNILFSGIETIRSSLYPNPLNITGDGNNNTIKIRLYRQKYTMKIAELFERASVWDMTNTKTPTFDAPYNIFALPLGKITLKDVEDNVICISNSETTIEAVNSIISKMQPSASGGFLYDIQLLPYCPIEATDAEEITIKSASDYSLITSQNNNIGFILNIPKSKFTKNIYLKDPIIINDVKIESECDFYKLCSPNWASEFKFNASKNGGIEYFNVDCEYKPYMPYIHINPNFGRLYGQDFNDARGLILSGDFSLSQISDAWQSYQITNKNFQNIFDRQIENMEIQHKYQRISDITGAITGTVAGASAGAFAGSTMAPGVGTIAGAVAGGVTSAVGGVADIFINEQLRNEALDYAHEQFEYNLGNIKALPYSLTKVTAFNNNNKLFPVLEYYTCTEEEKNALKNKLKYSGMTVMAIGKIKDYATTGITNTGAQFIKGKIIRLEGIGEEYHLAKQIALEINKGVFI